MSAYRTLVYSLSRHDVPVPREAFDTTDYRRAFRAAAFRAVELGLIKRDGDLWSLTAKGRDLTEGRVKVQPTYRFGTTGPSIVRATWIAPLPRATA